MNAFPGENCQQKEQKPAYQNGAAYTFLGLILADRLLFQYSFPEYFYWHFNDVEGTTPQCVQSGSLLLPIHVFCLALIFKK